MRPYRVKHIPTGLYYQPSSHGNNFSKKGKVYFSLHNCLSGREDFITITMNKSSRCLKEMDCVKFDECNFDTRLVIARLKISEFEIEYL